MERLAQRKSIAAYMAAGISVLALAACTPKEHRNLPRVPTAAREQARPCDATNIQVITEEAKPSEADCAFLQKVWGKLAMSGDVTLIDSDDWRIKKDRSDRMVYPVVEEGDNGRTYFVSAKCGPSGSLMVTASPMDGLLSREVPTTWVQLRRDESGRFAAEAADGTQYERVAWLVPGDAASSGATPTCN